MIKSNTYDVLRTFNKVLTEKQMFEEFDIPQTRKWLKDFYKIYRLSRTRGEFWEIGENAKKWCHREMQYSIFEDCYDSDYSLAKNSVDYSLAKNLTVDRMTYKEWQQFKDNLSAMKTKLYYINKVDNTFMSDFINSEIEKFRGFIHWFIIYANAVMDEVN